MVCLISYGTVLSVVAVSASRSCPKTLCFVRRPPLSAGHIAGKTGEKGQEKCCGHEERTRHQAKKIASGQLQEMDATVEQSNNPILHTSLHGDVHYRCHSLESGNLCKQRFPYIPPAFITFFLLQPPYRKHRPPP